MMMTEEQLKVLYTLVQKVEDLREDSRTWQTNHDKKSEEWREKVDGRLDSLEDDIKTGKLFWKVVAFSTGGVMGIAKGWVWIKDHFRP